MAVQYLSYTPMSDEEISEIAKRRISGAYDEQADLYQRQTDKKAAGYQSKIDKLEPEYSLKAAQVEEQYGQKRQNVSDEALARGFGRSSYVTDVLARTHDQQMSALSELSRQKAAEAENITAQIDALYDELFDNQAKLTTAKQNKLLSTIDQLRGEQAQREQEVLKYNADLALRQEQLNQQRELFYAQQQYDQQKLEADRGYREQQMALERERFAYQQNKDAAAAAQKAAEAAAKAKKSGGSAKKAEQSGIVFTGVRV